MNFLIHLTPIKIFFTIFALFAWSRAFLQFRAKFMNMKEITFWTFVWAFAIIVVVFIPGKTTLLAHLLGIERGFDAMIFIAVIALLYAVYRLYVKSNENEKIITDLVRQLALKNIEKSSKNRSIKRNLK